MPYTPEQRKVLHKSCELILPGFAATSPAEEFRRMAAWCEANDIEHDVYGDGALVESFEHKIAAMLGKPAAVFIPSGIMAQLTAVRIWTEVARLNRFGMHPTSHLARHEQEAYAALSNCHGVLLGDRLRPLLASDLDASRQPMACVIVELPIREAGGRLPDWGELEALKAAAGRRGIPLHMDGARLWESVAFYQKSHAEIAAGFDSVYVSVYKGIGGYAGALLAGSEDFVANARLWRKRMGGTLHHLGPMVASAAMHFDERIALMPALYRRALDLAASLAPQARLRVDPTVPQTNLLHLYFDARADAVMDARDDLATEKRCWVVDRVRPAEVPGWSVTELYVGDRLLEIGDEQLIALFSSLCDAMKATP